MGVDYVAAFNSTIAISDVRRELAAALNITNNGIFLVGSDFQLSEESDPDQVAELLMFQGK